MKNDFIRGGQTTKEWGGGGLCMYHVDAVKCTQSMLVGGG